MKNLYHKILRTTAVIVVVVLVFDTGLLIPITKDIASVTGQHIATVVGVGASVEPNDFNEFTAQISARERELDAREVALRSREIDARAQDSVVTTDKGISSYILSAVLFVLLVLIVLNYVLDWLRYREQHSVRRIATQ